MSWIKSNIRRPDKPGFYHTHDSIGTKGVTEFERINSVSDYHWHSITGHPVDEWWDEKPEFVSNCCFVPLIPESDICSNLDCLEHCEPININEK
jgi:hypothetical protein